MTTEQSYQIGKDWVNANTLSSIAIGKSVTIQNQGRPGDILEVYVGPTEPDSTVSGASIGQFDTKRILSIDPIWIRLVRYETRPGYDDARTCKAKIMATREIQDESDIDYSLIGGNAAITAQSFTELNSKLGTQYEAAFFSGTPLAQGNSIDLVFIVGPSHDVLIKDIITQFNSEQIQTAIYKSPTYAGGASVPVYNLNDRDAKASDVTILGGATVTNTGTQIGPTITTIGSTSSGNRAISTVSISPNAERVLARGETYLYRITNTGSADALISGVATWYQGPLSTQL